MSEPRKKIQKVTHSNLTIDEEPVEKMKTEVALSNVQAKVACSCGCHHTITLSNDGTIHSFGRNYEGVLGLGHNNDVSLPTPILNLPKINLISCGDYEGFIWSFGENNCGQLGTGNTTNLNVPQKLVNIPPVLSVSCGLKLHKNLLKSVLENYQILHDRSKSSWILIIDQHFGF